LCPQHVRTYSCAETQSREQVSQNLGNVVNAEWVSRSNCKIVRWCATITTVAFAAVGRAFEEAVRNIGASPLRRFLTVTLPSAASGIMANSVFVFARALEEFTDEG